MNNGLINFFNNIQNFVRTSYQEQSIVLKDGPKRKDVAFGLNREQLLQVYSIIINKLDKESTFNFNNSDDVSGNKCKRDFGKSLLSKINSIIHDRNIPPDMKERELDIYLSAFSFLNLNTFDFGRIYSKYQFEIYKKDNISDKDQGRSLTEGQERFLENFKKSFMISLDNTDMKYDFYQTIAKAKEGNDAEFKKCLPKFLKSLEKNLGIDSLEISPQMFLDGTEKYLRDFEETSNPH